MLAAHGERRYVFCTTRFRMRETVWLMMVGKNAALLTLLFQPALLLIDFGHFQYNSVMLGTFVARLARVGTS
jgi:ALG6, ALG8 glycosyltransferase family